MQLTIQILIRLKQILRQNGIKCLMNLFWRHTSWRPNKDCNILTSPAPPDITVCRSRSPGLLNRGSGGPASLGHVLIPASSHQLVWSPNSPSYIIVHSLTQSLEWQVCSSSSGNNCYGVNRSLSSGALVYDCSMGFYLVPYCQPSSPTRFLLITAIGMCHFLPVHHFGMSCLAGSKVNMQHWLQSQMASHQRL